MSLPGPAAFPRRWFGVLVYSIRGRIIAGVIALHAVLLGLVVWDLVSRQQQFMHEQLSRQGASLAQTLAVNAPSWLISNDLTGLDELVGGLKPLRELQLAVILDRSGRVRASTDDSLFNLVLDDEYSRALLASAAPRQVWHDGMIDSVAEIRASGYTIGYVRVILNTAPVKAEIDAVARHGLAYTVLAMLLGGLISWLVVRSMTGRLARLSEAADAIAAGNLHISVDDGGGRDEVARLTRDFSQMARSLADEQEQQARAEAALFAEKERAQVTLMSIGDAVITTDVAGCVEFLNPVAEQLTGWSTAEAHGRPLDEVFRIINEESRLPVENPIRIVLREGHVVGLANHTLLIRRDGNELNIEDSAAPIRDRAGQIVGVVLVFHDVTHAHELARQISWAASHDALTELMNRSEFEHRLAETVAQLEPGRSHALLYIDLDQFKVLNDTCGHTAGDRLLREIAVLMRQRLRDSDVLARLGGDEFGILLVNCDLDDGRGIAQEILDAIAAHHFSWDDKSFVVGASIGIVEIAGDGLRAPDLLAAVDAACYAAKEQGRNRIQVYSEAEPGLLARHGEMHWVGRINRAFEEGRFRLYFQPIVALRAGAGADHGEILLRMLDEEGRIVPPGSFLPAAERYSMMQRVDRWVITHALEWMATHDLDCAINLSGQSVGDERFLDFVLERIAASGIVASRICFEITETAAIASFDKAIRFMSELRGKGCRFALDDFGSGLSSFAYLKNLPVDYLKIDGNFVHQIDQDLTTHAMVAAINSIGQVMGLRTIAEFVENDAIRARLADMGVDYGQGYGIARPQPIEAFTPPPQLRACG